MSTHVPPTTDFFSFLQRNIIMIMGIIFHLKHSHSAFSTRQVTESTGFKTDLLIPLLPQDVHCYRNLFYMTTHISAAQMLTPPPVPPCLHHSSTPLCSTCGCCSSTLFINSFLMLPDGVTVIYGGLSVFRFVCVCARVHE